MEKCKYLLLLLTLMTILCSCSQKEKNADAYTRIYEKYKDIKSYQCIMTINISSNKTVKQYKIKQYYKSPDNYKVEVLEPEEIKGLVTVYSNSCVTTIQPEIEGKFTLLNFNPVGESYIFLPDFLESYYKSEQTSVMTMREQESRYTVLKADIPGNNPYRFSQSMWIDNQSLLPVKMEVYDIKNKPVISIRFDEFEFNAKLEDEVFQID
ncbi:MAG: hypothetical protein PWR27_59 [Petroclostridium sp.]|uniref:LolA family protein n=1 Tax=Petroclostridium xylanilyticum TaxID=1792311 RepID=UPI0012FF940D|nr:sigma-E factor regulatory protein RseB domain-containing protein [Petroclostridium xylanilyticum]MDK2809350.1 hypothetical protein [Petroclostridium sp.]